MSGAETSHATLTEEHFSTAQTQDIPEMEERRNPLNVTVFICKGLTSPCCGKEDLT